MKTPLAEGMLLWKPSEAIKQQANVIRYMQWLVQKQGFTFQTYEEQWEWSVTHLEDFWASLWNYFHIQASQPYSTVLVERKMPGARWFPGAELNYAEYVFRHATASRPCALFQSERQPLTELSWEELRQKVGQVAHALRAGCAAAFVARLGMILDPLVERPDIVGKDLREIADQIIAMECE